MVPSRPLGAVSYGMHADFHRVKESPDLCTLPEFQTVSTSDGSEAGFQDSELCRTEDLVLTVCLFLSYRRPYFLQRRKSMFGVFYSSVIVALV